MTAEIETGDRASGMKPPRAPWDGFPDVLIHAAEPAVNQHPACRASKSGVNTLVWSASVIVFLIGLVSEKITNFTYKRDS